MSGHEVRLNRLVFSSSSLWPICEGCGEQAPTAVVGTIDACSGAGYDIRRCRDCVAGQMGRARAQGRSGRTAELPSCG